MPANLSLYNRQDVIPLSDELLEKLEAFGRSAVALAMERLTGEASALSQLDELEVSLVDDTTIEKVHIEFMNVPGATDVITFDHGEVLISVETAQSQAQQYGQPWQRELALYLAHGLLHLAGHEDASEEGFETMAKLQEEIVAQLW